MNQILEAKTAALYMELRLFLVISIIYVVATLLYLICFFVKEERLGRAGTVVMTIGTVLHTILITFRWWEAGRPPFQTLYESLSWFAWCGSATLLIVMLRKPRIHITGLNVSFLSAGAMLFALFTRNPAPPPLSPPLQSYWFLWHVIVAFMSYAIFVVACSVEITYLFVKQRSPFIELGEKALEGYHSLSYRLVSAGFPLLTFAIVSGAAWANDAWGRFWSWDPKETWSLITWTVFAVYLHVMRIPKWRDKYGPYINILGFICMIMTFLGINWLSKLLGIPSMHVYAV